MSHHATPALEETAAFYSALLDAMQRARAAYPAVQDRIRQAAELVIAGHRAVDEPLGPCRCPEHAGPAPAERCRHHWATVLAVAAVQESQPAHWACAYTPAIREARAAHGNLVAQVASDFAHDRLY